MNDGIAGTAAGHNSKTRKLIIAEITHELDTIEVDIARLMADRKEVKKRVKADLGMRLADFNAMRRLASMDEGDRDTLLDVMREGLDALGVEWPGA